MRLLLDTTVLIDALRGRSAAARVRRLRSGGDGPPLASAINVEELWRGVRRSEAGDLRTLLAGLQVVPLGERAGTLAGNWRRDFAARGITVTQADCLIAAAAVTAGVRLATGNPRDFPMPGLELEHWPAGA